MLLVLLQFIVIIQIRLIESVNDLAIGHACVFIKHLAR